jgi:hypothetical protein
VYLYWYLSENNSPFTALIVLWDRKITEERENRITITLPKHLIHSI